MLGTAKSIFVSCIPLRLLIFFPVYCSTCLYTTHIRHTLMQRMCDVYKYIYVLHTNIDLLCISIAHDGSVCQRWMRSRACRRTLSQNVLRIFLVDSLLLSFFSLLRMLCHSIPRSVSTSNPFTWWNFGLKLFFFFFYTQKHISPPVHYSNLGRHLTEKKERNLRLLLFGLVFILAI